MRTSRMAPVSSSQTAADTTPGSRSRSATSFSSRLWRAESRLRVAYCVMVNLRAFSVFEPVPAVDCLEAGEDGSLFGAACDLRDPGERQQLAAIAAVRGHEHEAAAE